VKNSIKRILYYFGYEIRRIPGDLGQNRISTDLGQDPFQDMRKLAASPFRPVIFDVGANVGQSVNLFCRHFDQLIIHAFEPSLDTFRELQQQTAGVPDLHLNNFALGSRIESRVLIENVHSGMSSFLEPSVESWGKVKERCQVEVRTLDDYCAEQGLTHIDVLKLDTQGFDLEVIRGSQELIEQQGIHLLYMEMTFSDMYKGLPRLDEIYRLLSDHGFFLVSFYSFYYQHDRASWTDALFVNPEYQQSNNGLR
jgi:FkbM family methyltransferase